MRIIGIHGRKGTGKSTAAEFLCKKYDFEELAFATPLKKICMELFALAPGQVYGSQEDKETIDERWGVSPRWLMQQTGSALRGILPKNIWIDCMSRSIKNTGDYVISDVRFPDEAEWIRSRGGVIVTIKRDTPSMDMHESECQVITGDYIIHNHWTKLDLFRQLDKIIESVSVLPP